MERYKEVVNHRNQKHVRGLTHYKAGVRPKKTIDPQHLSEM